MTAFSDPVFRGLVRIEFDNYAKRLIGKIENLTIEKVIATNPYLLLINHPESSPGELIGSVLRNSIMPTSEVLWGETLEAILFHGINRHANGLAQWSTWGTGTDIDVPRIGDRRPMIIEVKSGPNWANGKSARAQRDALFACAAKAPSDVRLIEAIFYGCKKQRKIYTQGVHSIERLCGNDLFETVCGNRDFGWIVNGFLAEVSTEFAREMEFGSFRDYLDHQVALKVGDLLKQHRGGYKGLLLWVGNQWNWQSHHKLNSGIPQAMLLG